MTLFNFQLTGWKERLRGLLHRALEQRWLNVGLRAKMGLMIEIGVIALILIFLVLAISTARQNTQKILSERMMLARLSAATLDSTIRQVQSVLAVLSDRDALRQPDYDPLRRQAILAEAFQQLGMASRGLYLYDLSGRLLASTPNKSLLLTQNDLTGLRSLQPNNVPVLMMLESDPPVAAIAVPVRDPSEATRAYLLAPMDLEAAEFSPLRNGIELGRTGTLDVVAADGRVLISSHPERLQSSGQLAQLWNRLFLAGKPGVETCLGCGSQDSPEWADEVIAFAPLSQAPWGVVVRQKASELMAPVNRLLVQTLMLGAITVLGALLLVWVTTNSVIKPVQSLKEAAERIAQGDLDTPLEALSAGWLAGRGRRNDEIGNLAESFSAMRKQLKRSIDETNALNRELDARVQERTRAALSAQLEAQAARDDLRAIIDSLSDELIVVNVEDFSIQLANRTAHQHHGSDKLIGEACVQICHRGQPCQKSECECPVVPVVETGKSVRVTHVVSQNGSEQVIHKEITASPMRDVNGKITRVVELTRDVTEEKQIKDSLLRRNQQLSILNAVATIVNQSLNQEDILGKSLDAVLSLTGVDVGAVYLQEDLQGRLRLMAYRGLTEEAALLAADVGMLDSSCGGILEHGQIVIVPDLSRFRTRRARSLQRENLSTLVHVPLVAKGSVIGSICLGTRCRREFAMEEQELLTAIGSQIAVAVENARLYAEVQQKERMRGELFMKAISAQEEERKRIARELHDETSQSLAALLYAVEEGFEMDDLQDVRRRLEGMHDLVQHTLDGVHKLIFDLRPSMLDHLGLLPALRWYAETRLESRGTRVSVSETSEVDRLPAEVETALFRIVQEAVTNIARHAAARNVHIEYGRDDGCVMMRVEDDGIGFDPSDLTLESNSMRGLGLLGVKERLELLGGDLEIQSEPGSGTCLIIRVPVANGGQEHD
jgi:PAS domain S-box-containing protein